MGFSDFGQKHHCKLSLINLNGLHLPVISMNYAAIVIYYSIV